MIKILVTGDFAPQTRALELIVKGDHEAVFNDFLPELKGNDLNITNLECPLVEHANTIEKSGPNLKASPKCIQTLTFAGFNLVTLANNHIMDYGAEGLKSTMELCKQNKIDYIGAGNTLDEAEKIFYFEKEGIKLAIINIAENEFSIAGDKTPGANPLNPVRNFYKIKEAKANADYVVLIVHGGHENYSLPSPRMVSTYRFFIDSGADVVIGHHTHCYSGYETYKEGTIFYSLGNFSFDRNKRNADWNFGYAVNLALDKENGISYELIPYVQGDENPGVTVLKADKLAAFQTRIKKLNETIADPEKLDEEWRKFVQSRSMGYLKDLLPLNKYVYSAFRKLNLPLPISKKKKIRVLNLLRCESHHDVFLNALKNNI